ncbi:hypothetical protein ACGFNU_33995 [Spirillospora sp. NPDC048911]|uniref:hypothetical protein n=1 Tax=Spirillospora sp. NPDC048911 TaxID=3364527 RepID=UPI003711755D
MKTKRILATTVAIGGLMAGSLAASPAQANAATARPAATAGCYDHGCGWGYGHGHGYHDDDGDGGYHCAALLILLGCGLL